MGNLFFYVYSNVYFVPCVILKRLSFDISYGALQTGRWITRAKGHPFLLNNLPQLGSFDLSSVTLQTREDDLKRFGG